MGAATTGTRAPVTSRGGAWAHAVGQDVVASLLAASARSPIHAYLLAGGRGSGKSRLAAALTAALVCERSDACGACRPCRLALDRSHPDVAWVARSRSVLRYRSDSASADEWTVERVVREAALSPAEARYRVFVVPELQHLQPDAVPALLKTLEEPPDSTIFVLLADVVPPDLVTVASRCMSVEVPLPDRPALVAHLVEACGLSREEAVEVAEAAGGRLDRAELLATDDSHAERSAHFASLARRLDGTGATVAALVDELGLTLDEVAEGLLTARHAEEMASVSDQVERWGMLRSLIADTEHRHRQERRRVRTDELIVALGAISSAYRDAVVSGSLPAERGSRAIRAIGGFAEMLERHPNERLQLQRLLMNLPALGS